MNDGVSTAHAHWNGSTIAGSGTVSTTSDALDAQPLTWKARTGETAGTTPEELLAAAHSGCFAMAFSFALTNEGHEPTSLDVDAEYTFGPIEGGFAIKGAKLSVTGDVPGIEEAKFLELAEGAKTGCPVSKAMSGIEITLDAKLGATA